MQLRKQIAYSKNLRHFTLPILASIFLFCVYFTLNGNFPFTTNAQTATTVTFGSVGDMGSDSNANGVLNAVKSANLNFFLHVGDLSYNTQGSPQGWDTWVKGIVGTVLPYEIVTGNHDSSQIDQFTPGLPDHFHSNGTYGKNYYFDYPQTSPLVRVIMISPEFFDPDMTWLGNAIDSARSSGIKWVVVGNHVNAISSATKSNEMGTLFSYLISKKVDLILQGHDHNYQRSKQLNCVTIGSTNQSCIVSAGPTYTKGSGTVLVIDGAGGNGLYAVNPSDSEAGYFAKINSDTYGFAKFTLTATQLQEQFVRGAGGSLSDSFTISGSTGPVPTGVPTPTGPSPTFACLGSCPTSVPTPFPTTQPSGSPSIPVTNNPQPTSSQAPQPSQTTSGVPSHTPNPSVSPTPNPGGGNKKHKPTNGGIQQLIQLLLQFLMQILQLLQNLFK